MWWFIIIFVLLSLVGFFSSYDGNPLKGYLALWHNLTNKHEKEFNKTSKETFYECKCGACFFKGNFKKI